MMKLFHASPIVCLILAIDSNDSTSTACGEKWLKMSRGFDPTLALVYSHVQKEAFTSKLEEKNAALLQLHL